LVVAKIDKEIDIDWSEIVDLLGLDCSGDHLRKTSYGIYESYQNNKDKQIENIGDESVLKELDLKKFELQKERQKFFDQRRELKKINIHNGRRDYLEEYIINAANNLNQIKPLDFKKYRTDYTDCEAVIIFSDWHYGMVTDNIWNTYNTDICRERVETLVAKTKEYINLHKPRKLNVILLGDCSHGSIHTTVRVEAEEDACDQLMQATEIMAEAIAELSRDVKETNVYSTYGNHMRTIQNKKDSKHSDNMEKIVPWWLNQRFQDKEKYNINIVDAEYYEFIKLNVLGYNIVATHGDLDKIKDFGVTINTIFTKKYHEEIHYTILADKHHLEEFEQFDIENILVRSLCGTDGFANDHRLYSNAGQTLMFFTREDGRTATYNIKLS
jgi:hypothetical protein